MYHLDDPYNARPLAGTYRPHPGSAFHGPTEAADEADDGADRDEAEDEDGELDI